MTEAQWNRVGSNRSGLAKLLANPIMVEALGVLRDSEVPRIEKEGKCATDVMILNCLDHARRCGFFEAIAALQALAQEPEPKKKAPTTRRLLDKLPPETPQPETK